MLYGRCARGPDWRGKRNTQAIRCRNLASDDPYLQLEGVDLFRGPRVMLPGRAPCNRQTAAILTADRQSTELKMIFK